MKKHKFAIILLIIGTILVVMGLSLTIYNYMNNKNNENKEIKYQSYLCSIFFF